MGTDDMRRVIAAQVQAFDFDHVFTLTHVGVRDWRISEPENVWAPEVYVSEDGKVDIESDAWETGVTTGMSGQYSYNGPVMHSSELIGPGIAEAMMFAAEEEPQTFTVVVVYGDGDGEDEDPAPAGWTILRKV